MIITPTPIADNNVWGGSILRCNYKPAGYYVAGTGLGCTLRLTGVQVKKLVEGQLGTAGFTEVERMKLTKRTTNEN